MAAWDTRANEIVANAIDIANSAKRSAYLDEACRDEAELRQRVEVLLRAHDATRSSLAISAQADNLTTFPPGGLEDSALPVARARATEQIGDVIADKYKLVQQLGEGGMGAVWVAEQDQPIKRRVALKVIKPGVGSDTVLRRFEAERQALAMMDHANIAKILDGGETPSGRPFFVMELVKGIPITRYCDERHLAIRDRLRLFVPVCQAIQHAHQKGIIHRDIKPSNVLVAIQDGVPVPKVIDFGVAKAIHQRLTDRTLNTEIGAVVGTLEYMSPEQAEFSALDIDTRTDVYALGVLLYELLTGTTPVDRKQLGAAAIFEMLRIIKEDEPPKPSTRLTQSKESLASVAAQRRTEPSRLTKEVRGELDWIVMKCLEKDRTRRYDSAGGLANDIERYMADEPVLAGPPSKSYRLRKFVRRNRGPVLAATLVLVALVGGIIGTTMGLMEARQQRDSARDASERESTQRERAEANEAKAKENEAKALKSAEEARAVLGFFSQRVLAAGRPKGQEGGLGRDVSLVAAIDAAESWIAKSFKNQPVVEASVRHTLAESYLYLGDLDKAIKQAQMASDIRRTQLGPDDNATLLSENVLAVAYQVAKQDEKAIPVLERILEIQKRRNETDKESLLLVMNNLANSYRGVRKWDQALALFREVVELMKVENGPDDMNTLICQGNLASTLRASGRLSESLPVFQQTYDTMKAKYGATHPNTLTTLNNLARAHQAAGNRTDALPMLQQALQGREEVLGPMHLYTLQSVDNLGQLYRDMGDHKGATSYFERAANGVKAKLGLAHPEGASYVRHLIDNYERLALLDKAEPWLRDFAEFEKKRAGPDSAPYSAELVLLGSNLLSQKKLPEAETVLRNCLTIREKQEPDAWTTFQTKSLLGGVLLALKKYPDAEPLLLAGYEGMKQREAKIPAQVKQAHLTDALERFGPLYDALGKKDEAKKWRKELAAAKTIVNVPPAKP